MNAQLTISEESLVAIYPYRDNKGRHILEESIEDYAEEQAKPLGLYKGKQMGNASRNPNRKIRKTKN